MVNIQRPTKIMGKPILNTDIPTDEQVLTFDSGDDNWQAEDGGGAALGKFIMGSIPFDIPVDGVKEYSGPFATSTLAAESQRQLISPLAFTAKTLSLDISSNTNTDDTIFTIRKEGAGTALTITVAATLTGKFTFSTDVSFDKGDLMSLELDNTLNTESMRFDNWSVECEA